jgi:hypothetical protein
MHKIAKFELNNFWLNSVEDGKIEGNCGLLSAKYFILSSIV